MAFRNIQIEVDNSVFQAATRRASGEGKAIGQVVAEFITQYVRQAQASPAATYTVQRGDTLGRIATRFYGDARKYPLIQRANNIANPSLIWVNQVLVIPPASGNASVTTTTPPPPTLPPPPVTPPPVRTGAPPKPPIQWVGSPNFNQRRSPDDISAIVIHATANDNLAGVVSWFNNPQSQVSAHYSIGKDGKIVQHVQDKDRAWHAGRSVWKGRSGCNDYAVGIELVNLNNGPDPYPEPQHRANVGLCVYLCDRYKVAVDDIMGHVDIALPPGRKSDPRNYDLDRLRREVAAALGR